VTLVTALGTGRDLQKTHVHSTPSLKLGPCSRGRTHFFRNRFHLGQTLSIAIRARGRVTHARALRLPDQGKYRLHEFVVMPDHFHLLITVDSDTTIARAVQLIKGGFSYRAGMGFKGPVWQKGSSEVRVLDEETFMNQATYIRNNPVAAHLVVTPEAYPYSSVHYRAVLDPPPQRLKPIFLAELTGTPEGVP
jgi:putative transposase